MVVNLILGIAAMPRTIVPAQDSFSGHTSVQYLLSLLPTMFIGDNTAQSNSIHAHNAIDPAFVALALILVLAISGVRFSHCQSAHQEP